MLYVAWNLQLLLTGASVLQIKLFEIWHKTLEKFGESGNLQEGPTYDNTSLLSVII